jgi:hypothetical protein
MPRADRPRAETFSGRVGSIGVWVARFATTSTSHSMEPEPVNIPNPLRGAAIAVGGLLVLAGVALASGQGPSTGPSAADPTATAVDGFLTAASPTPSTSPDDELEDDDEASIGASPSASPGEDDDDASIGASPSASPDGDDDGASTGASPSSSPDDDDEDDDDSSGPGGDDDDDHEDDDNSGPGGGDDDEHDD